MDSFILPFYWFLWFCFSHLFALSVDCFDFALFIYWISLLMSLILLHWFIFPFDAFVWFCFIYLFDSGLFDWFIYLFRFISMILWYLIYLFRFLFLSLLYLLDLWIAFLFIYLILFSSFYFSFIYTFIHLHFIVSCLSFHLAFHFLSFHCNLFHSLPFVISPPTPSNPHLPPAFPPASASSSSQPSPTFQSSSVIYSSLHRDAPWTRGRGGREGKKTLPQKIPTNKKALLE